MKYSLKKRRINNSNINSIKSINNISINKRLNSKNNAAILKGGKFLGRGNFGCVISPALACSDKKIFKTSNNKAKTKTKTKTNKNADKNNNLVSKIILIPDEDIQDEINISNKLKSIDPEQQYFLTINKYCKVKKIPKDRTNVVKVQYLNNNNSEHYNKLENKTLDKVVCGIDLSAKPINLIMTNGGYDLFDIGNIINDYGLDNKNIKLKESTKHKIKTSNMLFDNLKDNINNLLKGLLKMHQNRIVNRDIKQENIMINYDDKIDKFYIRYIDYGLSEILTPSYCADYKNINAQGTPQLIPIEIYITFYINKYYKHNKINKQGVRSIQGKYGKYNTQDIQDIKDIQDIQDIQYNDTTYDKIMMYDINKDVNEHVKQILKSLNISVSDLNSIVIKLFSEIKTMFNNKTILYKYFGINDILNGYLQKGDIYALGITLYEFLDVYTKVINIKKDIRLYDLIKHMIDLNPNTRYNALQCLKHPYFTH
jgi:serine/threonine protein kinase